MSGILATATAAADFNVGKMPYGTRHFPGNVRNLRIWVGEARSAAQIASDYSSTPLAGSGSDDSDFSWPLNETAVGAVANGKGGVGLTMTNVLETDFVACCTNNRASGEAMVYRPSRIDLGSEDSESVILVQAKDYSGSALRFRVLPPLDAVGNVMTSSALEAWDHVNKAWIGSGAINTGVLMDNTLGNPATGSYFWVPVRRNTSSAGAGRYVDDDTQTGYDGTDTDAGLWYYWLEALEMDGNSQFYGPVVVLLEEPDNPAPPSLIIPGINSIYPNPFGSSTQIRYGLVDPGDTELRIFNLRGQVIKTWSYPNQARGTYSVYWDNLGTDLPNGVYILQFLSGKRSETRRITLLK